MKKLVLTLMGAAVACGLGCTDSMAAKGKVESKKEATVVAEEVAQPAVTESSSSSDAPKVSRTKIIKVKKATRTTAQKKELGLLKFIHRVNVNGNAVVETQDPKVILASIAKHMGKVIQIEERRVLNDRSFDMDFANVEINNDGWLAEDILLQFNGFKYVGRYPQHILTEVEECLQIAVEKQENMQILVKPKAMCK